MTIAVISAIRVGRVKKRSASLVLALKNVASHARVHLMIAANAPAKEPARAKVQQKQSYKAANFFGGEKMLSASFFFSLKGSVRFIMRSQNFLRGRFHDAYGWLIRSR